LPVVGFLSDEGAGAGGGPGAAFGLHFGTVMTIAYSHVFGSDTCAIDDFALDERMIVRLAVRFLPPGQLLLSPFW